MALQPPSGSGPIAGVNLTPLIDIMLVLLLVTMVVGGTTTATVSVALPTPDAPSATPAAPAPRTLFEVTLDERGAVSIGGEPIEGGRLVSTARAFLAAHEDIDVVIAAAAGSRHEDVMDLLVALQKAGARDVSFRVESGATQGGAGR